MALGGVWPGQGTHVPAAACAVLISRALRSPGTVTAPLQAASRGPLCRLRALWVGEGCVPMGSPRFPRALPSASLSVRDPPGPGVQALRPSVFRVDVSACVCPQASRGRLQPGVLSVSVSACRDARGNGQGSWPPRHPRETGARALPTLAGGNSRQEQAQGGTGHPLPAPTGDVGLRAGAWAESPGRCPTVGNRAVRRRGPPSLCLDGDRHVDDCWDPPASPSLGHVRWSRPWAQGCPWAQRRSRSGGGWL